MAITAGSAWLSWLAPRRRCARPRRRRLPLERDAAERPRSRRRTSRNRARPAAASCGRARLARGGRSPARRRSVADAGVELERLLIRRGGAIEVVALLRHAPQIAGGAPQRVAAIGVAVGQLRDLALAGRVAEPARLFERVGAAVDVAEPGHERAGKPDERIGPDVAQLRGLAERGDGRGELPPRRVVVSLSRLNCVAVDAVRDARRHSAARRSRFAEPGSAATARTSACAPASTARSTPPSGLRDRRRSRDRSAPCVRRLSIDSSRHVAGPTLRAESR